jgi:hypothetical protein
MNIDTETLGPIRRLLAVGGAAVAGALALTGCGMLEDAATENTADDEVSSSQLDAAADAAAGDCLPEPPVGGPTDTFAIECDSAEAFWTLTAIEANPDVLATADGSVEDPAAVYELCGEEVNAQIPGQAWTDWNMIYDQTTLKIDYLFCLEAIGNPTPEGATPVVPSAAGECFSTADFMLGTYDCNAGVTDATIASVITVDQAEWETVDYDALAMEQCTSSSYFPATDIFGRTAAVFCID